VIPLSVVVYRGVVNLISLGLERQLFTKYGVFRHLFIFFQFVAFSW